MTQQVAGVWRFDFVGEGAPASAPMTERADPMLTYAMTVLAANKQARLRGLVATFGRVECEPSSSDRVPLRVTGWLDVRGGHRSELDAYVAEVASQARARADRDGTAVEVTPGGGTAGTAGPG